ncbi:MAG: YciI-like protein [Sediminibacterium sp.]|nr:YciI-like protein [Sediminibacterium sp.]
MRKQISSLVAVMFCMIISANAQNDRYDSVMAKRTGADDYGMKSYVLAFLKTGDGKITDKARINALLMDHLKNIGKLAAEGKLVLAGPMMGDNKGIEGIFVFNVRTVAEAELLGQSDPAVKAGLFSIEYHPWYATAALMEIPEMHKKLEKKKML